MGWMFSSAVFLFCVRVSDKVCVNVCVCVCVCARVFSFFPGQGNHVLYIGIIKFMTHRPRSRSLSHRTYSEREREREDIYPLLNVFSYHSQTGCRWWLSHK